MPIIAIIGAIAAGAATIIGAIGGRRDSSQPPPPPPQNTQNDTIFGIPSYVLLFGLGALAIYFVARKRQ